MDGAVARGTGLASLQRYLTAHGGVLTAGPGEPGFFRVEAVVPVAAVAEARA